MNNVSENQAKDRLLKTLAVGGLVGLIIIIAWLSIKMVVYLPTAISSLASLADSVYNYKTTEITSVPSANIVNVDQAFDIHWNLPTKKGTFAFSYACVEGVALDVRDNDGSIKNINCDTNYNIGSTDKVVIMAKSEKERYVDVAYRVDFIPTKAIGPTASSTGLFTIVNPTISPITEPTEPDNDIVTEEEKPATTTPTTPTTPTKPKPAPKPQYIQEYIYGIPTSNPNGVIDLSAKFLSSGYINSNNQYLVATTIKNNTTGAIQFEVKNIGTKTSDTWHYLANLPNGKLYTSPTQKALKPNERAVIVLGFSTPNITGVKNTTVTVTVQTDKNLINNSFGTSVLITN